VSVKVAKASIGKRARVIGNSSPSRTLLFGTPASVKAEAKQCISDVVDILAPGSGIVPGVSGMRRIIDRQVIEMPVNGNSN
jgi:[methyl-Co(III) methanol-specific corrinoid protein]:coenzyme M methyltransferase